MDYCQIYDNCYKQMIDALKDIVPIENMQFELLPFLYVIGDYALMVSNQDRRSAANIIMDHIVNKYIHNQEGQANFHKRVDFYGTIIRGRQLRADWLIGDLDVKNTPVTVRCYIVLGDILTDPYCADHYDDAPILIRGIFDNYTFALEFKNAYIFIDDFVINTSQYFEQQCHETRCPSEDTYDNMTPLCKTFDEYYHKTVNSLNIAPLVHDVEFEVAPFLFIVLIFTLDYKGKNRRSISTEIINYLNSRFMKNKKDELAFSNRSEFYGSIIEGRKFHSAWFKGDVSQFENNPIAMCYIALGDVLIDARSIENYDKLIPLKYDCMQMQTFANIYMNTSKLLDEFVECL